MAFVSTVSEAVLILSGLMIFHTWIGYPLTLLVMRQYVSGKIGSDSLESKLLPVSVIIPIYNASEYIVEKLRNTLALDYPPELTEIIVVSDGSSNDSVEKAKSVPAKNVVVLEIKPNQGKSAAQNFAVKSASNEIIVFTDVDSILDKFFVRHLMPYFADPNVACVGGNSILLGQDGAFSQTQGFYWKLERFLRNAESGLGMLHSLPGWAFAIRRSDFVELDKDTGDDLILGLEMALKRRHSMIALDAAVYDKMPSNIKGEVKARQRITLRSITGLMRRKTLLNPFLYPRMAFAIWSHKVLRWLTPVFLITFLLSNIWLVIAEYRPIYGFLLMCQLAVYMFGLAGAVGTKLGVKVPLAGFIYSFLVGNFGLLMGLLKYVKGDKISAYKNIS